MDGAGDFAKKLSFYKPNKRGTGAAMQFDFNEKRECVFLEAARQQGMEQKFDWANKMVFKLGVTDIAKILVVLEGKADKADLFHDPSKSKLAAPGNVKNTALNVQKGAGFGYYFKLSMQMASGSVDAVQLALSEDEAVLLRVMLKRAVERVYNW